MKKTLLSLAVFSAAVVSPQLALAAPGDQTGTITFNGSVIAQTCKINNGARDFDVSLPAVSAQSLQGKGTTSGTTRFEIKLTECDPAAGNVRAFFEHASGNNAEGRLNNTAVGGAKQVDIELVPADDMANAIVVGSSVSQQKTKAVPLQGGAATLAYAARYYSTGAASAGAVLARAVYTIAYQ